MATGFSIVYISRNNGRSARTAQEGPLFPSPSPCQMPAAATRLVPWLPFLGLLACHAGPAATSPGPIPEARYDVILADGKVMDGTGNAWFQGDVGVTGDRITWVGPAGSLTSALRRGGSTPAGWSSRRASSTSRAARTTTSLWATAAALSKVTQGVTTEIMGEAYTRRPGTTPWPHSAIPLRLRRQRHGQARRGGARRPARLRELAATRCSGTACRSNAARFSAPPRCAPTSRGSRPGRRAPEQLDSMRALMRGAMEDGAFGLGVGADLSRPATTPPPRS